MSNHGVVAYGADLDQAYMKMETVEHFAKIALVTHLLGRQQPLGEAELEKLIVARAKYGAQSAASMPLTFVREPRAGNNNRKQVSRESGEGQEVVSSERGSR